MASQNIPQASKKSFWKFLNNIDPMPWHQAILLGIAFFALICLAIFGNYVD